MIGRLRAKLRDMTAKFGVNALQSSGLYNGYWQLWRGPLFEYAERKGLHILPVHYYTPIPNDSDTSRRRPTRLAGIQLDIAGGAQRARELLSRYQEGIARLLSGANGFNPNNAGFHPLDAALLYASVREAKPKRVIEIGSGMSSFAIDAAIRDGSLETRFSCIEPFLPDYLRNGAIKAEIIEKPLQDVPLAKFQELESGDILFIDSTHVVRFDSDVIYEILEIMPTLAPGVILHVHDIFLPDDYPEAWLRTFRFFWNEQYMLQAFLSMNPNFKIEIPVHAIKDQLDFVSSSDVEPASFWMRRT